MKKVISISSICISTTLPLGIQERSYCTEELKKENSTQNPVHYMRSILPTLVPGKRNHATAFGKNHSQEDLDNYDMESVRAIRANDIGTLRAILAKGKSMNACNRNGETLLHLACRRGNMETVQFLVEEADVDVNVQDDMGRHVLHDVCWRPKPDTAIMELLLRVVDPELLLAEDARGHTCFDYCRKEHWEQWTNFLRDHSQTIKRRAELIAAIRSSFDN